MPVFTYKAAERSGKIIRGQIKALNEGEAVRSLQENGLILLDILAPGQKKGKEAPKNYADLLKTDINWLFSRVKSKDTAEFTRDISSLISAGLPVDRALMILAEGTDNQRLKKIIHDILARVQGGRDLSDALASHPRVFSAFYVNMIRAGEAGGVLDAVLKRLAEYMESSQELLDFLKTALVYPIFLVIVSGLSIIVLLTFVIPRFTVIFEDMGATLPASTLLLIEGSRFLREYWWIVLCALVVLAFLARMYISSGPGRFRVDTWKLRFPLIGRISREVAAARFGRTLGTLMKSGAPILTGLELTAGVMGNQVVEKGMMKVQERVKEGERLSMPLGDMDVFPGLAVRLVTVGEETGNLDEMLLRVADTYEKAVRNRVRRFTNLLEPLLILIMGGIVGFIVISMLLAVFSINDIPF